MTETGEAIGRDPQAAVMDFVQRLSTSPGVSGREGETAQLVREAFSAAADETRSDPLGNLYFLRRGRRPAPRPRLLVAAHQDEIGLLVTHIDERGFLRVAAVGGVDPRSWLGREVVVQAAGGPLPGVIGLVPPHLLTASERDKVIPVSELFVDIGYAAEEARRRVRVGDAVTCRQSPVPLLHGRLAGKAMDDRASLAALFALWQQLDPDTLAADVWVVATVQEEVGLRGAETAAFNLAPDVAVAVDVGFAEFPGQPGSETLRLGGGPALTVGPNVHPGVREALVAAARDAGVPFQEEVEPGSSGTDAWAFQVSRSGVPTALLSLPLRYMHHPVEVVDPADILATGRLLAHFAQHLTARQVEEWQVWN